MPQLKGSYPQDSKILSWCGTFMAKYDIENSKITYPELMRMRLDSISWIIAKSLMQRNMYLFGINDCAVQEDSYFGGSLLWCSLLVGDLTENNLSIDELGYWEEKYQERLIFELMAYVSRDNYTKQTLNKPFNFEPVQVPSPSNYLSDVQKEYIRNIRDGIYPSNQGELPKKEPRKWLIINKGKI